MTVDVEEHFQVSAFESTVNRESWGEHESRVERNVSRILELFRVAGVQATFFVLGWVAERYPALIAQIVAGGHEIASHGYAHIRANTQTRQEFSSDVARTKKILEDVSGQTVVGYRAASFSIGTSNLWALESLKEAGYEYSSSIYPVRHDHYGMPESPRFPFHVGSSDLVEIPVTTVSFLRRNLPCGGGGYFRLLPYWYSRWAIGRVNRLERQSAVFYFHPWEIDPSQPRQPSLNIKTRLRHYTNLGRMEGRLERVLREFKWGRMDDVFLTRKASFPHIELGNNAR